MDRRGNDRGKMGAVLGAWPMPPATVGRGEANAWCAPHALQNGNAALVFEFLNKMIALMESYFGSFTDLSVKNNFSVIYELLDGTNSPCGAGTREHAVCLTSPSALCDPVASPRLSIPTFRSPRGARLWLPTEYRSRVPEAVHHAGRGCGEGRETNRARVFMAPAPDTRIQTHRVYPPLRTCSHHAPAVPRNAARG